MERSAEPARPTLVDPIRTVERQPEPQQRVQQPLLGALQILELSAPSHVVAGRKVDLLGDGLLRVGDEAADIPVPEVDEDIERELRVLGPFLNTLYFSVMCVNFNVVIGLACALMVNSERRSRPTRPS